MTDNSRRKTLSRQQPHVNFHGETRTWATYLICNVDAEVGRLGVDIADGAVAGTIAAPFVAIIDTAVTQNASRVASMSSSLRRSMSDFGPHFFKTAQFKWVAFVYCSSYITVNVVTTLCHAKEVKPMLPVLASSSLVNSSTAIAKDRAFARMFGFGVARNIPAASYALWMTRDILASAAIYALPPVLSVALQDATRISERAASVSTQFAVPILAQVPCTAFHLGGLDCYNNANATVSARWAIMRAEYGKTLLARVFRGLAPYFLAAVVNRELKAAMELALEARGHAQLSEPEAPLK